MVVNETMPLEANESPDGDKVVTPFEVESGVDVFCKHCGERMRVRRSYTRESGAVVIRHFTHISEGGVGASENGCSGGGEGDAHLRAKGIAVETLKEFYPQADVESEGNFDLSGFFEKGRRIGDVVVTFDEPNPRMGLGIVLEVQDKHKDKNVLETTRSYLSKGYSVCWLSVDSFGKYSLKYGKEEFEALVRNDFPDSKNVFKANLNPNGTVPRKEMYPLVSSVWPDAVEISGEIKPRVDSGWCYSAFESDGLGHVRIQSESKKHALGKIPEKEIQLPEEWYMERAREYFRETEWSELFEPYVWDTQQVKEEWGDLAKIDEMKVKIHLEKWLSDSQEVMLVGEDAYYNGGLSRSSSIGVVNHCRILPIQNEDEIIAFVPQERLDEFKKNELVLIDRDAHKNTRTELKDFEVYEPVTSVWQSSRYANLFSNGLQLPISSTADENPTTPRGDVPFSKWIESEGPTPKIKQAVKTGFRMGREKMSKYERQKSDAKERVPAIIKHNTGGPQPDSISEGTIVRIASYANITPDSTRWAVGQLCEEGMLKRTEDGKYMI